MKPISSIKLSRTHQALRRTVQGSDLAMRHTARGIATAMFLIVLASSLALGPWARDFLLQNEICGIVCL